MKTFIGYFSNLYTSASLKEFYQDFITFLKTKEPLLAAKYEAATLEQIELSLHEESTLLLNVAPYVEEFLALFFEIQDDVQCVHHRHHELKIIYFAKRQFVQRYALKRYAIDTLTKDDFLNAKEFLENMVGGLHDEIKLAQSFSLWIKENESYQEALKQASIFTVFAVFDPILGKDYKNYTLFNVPATLDFEAFLEKYKTPMGYCADNPKALRDGFNLTDHGVDLNYALDQAQYCIGCAKQGKDSCSKGLKNSEEEFQKNPLNVSLWGCPLEQKISEMNELKSKGYIIAALAIAMVDNPMLPLSGHRICNDCAKACIYQKQDPVNIPCVETQNLKDVLNLPFGIEIYTLLTFWNPLNLKRPYKKEKTGKRILVVGAGPAGITLSHHLLMDGHEVVLIEGAKIDPLPENLNAPLHYWQDFEESLENRIPSGFGGVADYGITVRWNKNFLKLVRLTLERHNSFQLIGGVRFGGNITIRDAFQDFDIDHIALCMGSGKPTLLEIPGNLAKGVIQASDFLMSLQLTGAFQKNTWANLQIRFPIVVIGGGLTAIDTATEALAYYPRYVENTMHAFNSLSLDTQESFLSSLSFHEKEIFDELAHHGNLFQEEKKKAEKEKRAPNFFSILNALGGVKVLYRNDFKKSPSYTLNHEEVKHALNEGIEIVENAVPLSILLDSHHNTIGIEIQRKQQQEIMKAKTIIVAMGTKPNTNIVLDENSIKENKRTLAIIDPISKEIIEVEEKNPKTKEPSFLCYLDDHFKGISFYGDMHPSFAGSVVKAMASAKRGYSLITTLLKNVASYEKRLSLKTIKEKLSAKVHTINKVTTTITEITIESPYAAKNFKPGQFFRLQNYHHSKNIPLEPLALTGAKVDLGKGHISLFVLDQGVSSKVASQLKSGEEVILMGPTGEPSKIPSHKNVLLIGGGVGNAVLFSIGKAMRQQGCNVIYFAGYKKEEDIFDRLSVEDAADFVVWCCDEKLVKVSRQGDTGFHGNMIDALKAYAGNEFALPITLKAIDQTLVVGSQALMGRIQDVFKNELSLNLSNQNELIASVNSPMQCMMKGVCAKCLQKHIDPITQKIEYMYSCAHQDQQLMTIDFHNLVDRLTQNTLLEKLKNQLLIN